MKFLSLMLKKSKAIFEISVLTLLSYMKRVQKYNTQCVYGWKAFSKALVEFKNCFGSKV